MTLSAVANIADSHILSGRYTKLVPRYDKCLNNGGEYVENSLKNVESDNNKILYETLLDRLKRNGTYCLNKHRILLYYSLEMLTTYQHPIPLSRNLGTLTSWSPLGLFRTALLYT